MLEDLVMEPTKEIVNPTDDAIITDSLLWGTKSETKIHMFIIQHPKDARRLVCSNAQNSSQSDPSKLIGCTNSAIDDLLAGFDSEVKPSESNSEIDQLLNGTGET